jgi:hypothetical protein
VNREELAKVCAWKRPPKAWRELPPGSPYGACSPLVGRTVDLGRRGGRVTVTACATPIPFSAAEGRKHGKEWKCQGAYEVQTPLGIRLPIRKSAVREQARAPRGGLCDRVAEITGPDDLRALRRQAEAAGVEPFEAAGEYPFPHRKSAGPCCYQSPAYPATLREHLSNPLLDDGELVEIVRAAGLDVRSRVDVERTAGELAARCWAILEDVARGRTPARKESAGRTAAQKRAAAVRRGEDVDSAGTDYREGLKTEVDRLSRRYGLRYHRPGM